LDDTDHNIGFDFYDEDTGVDCSLESISLVELSSDKGINTARFNIIDELWKVNRLSPINIS
jgi:hypothetical protein